ncbi:arginase [Zalerion maritima]|uniref:Arginase n=1 Tax=Zalerion maritima TaxID=339359 RepID=A0AAD5WX73_9PEZI|nr:arginase [Zalerion maritima]
MNGTTPHTNDHTSPPRRPLFTSMIPSRFLSNPSDLGVLGVCFNRGQTKKGVDTGPQALIDAGLLSQLEGLGYTLHGSASPTSSSSIAVAEAEAKKDAAPPSHVHDYRNLLDPLEKEGADPPHRNMKNPVSVSQVTAALSDQIYAHASQGRMVLTLGGDHSIAMGTVSGVSRGIRSRFGASTETALVWVDAHADLNRPEDSPSGNVHGMPVAFLTGIAEETSSPGAPFAWLKDPSFRTSYRKLVYIALRDVDAGEKMLLREYGIKAFSMHDIDRHGIGKIMDMCLAHIGTDVPVHLSFDVDALDPMWAPSTGTPVRGGLTLREGDFICEALHETGQLVAVDLVEVNPHLAPDEMGKHDTVTAGCSLVRCALGESVL